MKVNEITDKNKSWQSLKDEDISITAKILINEANQIVSKWDILSKNLVVLNAVTDVVRNLIQELSVTGEEISRYPDQEDSDLQELTRSIRFAKKQLEKLVK